MFWLLLLTLLTWPYISLELTVPIGTHTLNAPLADIFALALVPLMATTWRPANHTPLPGGWGYGLLMVSGLIGLSTALDTGVSLHFLVRKPLFMYLIYGGVCAWVVARELSRSEVLGLLAITATTTSLISLFTSMSRIFAGDALWFQAIDGLTNNHKTLAVALAPLIPLLLGLSENKRPTWVWGVVGLTGLALLASVSRTAWIAVAASLCWFIPYKNKTLAQRPWLVVGIVVIGILGALYGPLLTGSLSQLDAARSRHSLNKRALEMFLMHPLWGTGGGSNIIFEQQTFPDYRVNGVDAHGVVQKVGSELGLMGLVGYGWFFVACLKVIKQKPSLFPAFVALHVNLLLSTETFSQTHWLPFSILWGLAHQDDTSSGVS